MSQRNIYDAAGFITGVVDEPDSPSPAPITIPIPTIVRDEIEEEQNSRIPRASVDEIARRIGELNPPDPNSITVNFDPNTHAISIGGPTLPEELQPQIQQILDNFIGNNVSPAAIYQIRQNIQNLLRQHQSQSGRQIPEHIFWNLMEEQMQSRLPAVHGGGMRQTPLVDPEGDPTGFASQITYCFDLTIQPIYSMQVQFPLAVNHINVTLKLLEPPKQESTPVRQEISEVVLDEQDLAQEKWFAPVKVTGYQTPWGFIHEPDRLKLFLYKLERFQETVSKFLKKVNTKIGTGGQFEPDGLTHIIRSTLFRVAKVNHNGLDVHHASDNAVVFISCIINSAILAGVYLEEIEDVLKDFNFNEDKDYLIKQIKLIAGTLADKIGRRLGADLVPMPIRNYFTGPTEVTMIREKSTPGDFRDNLTNQIPEQSGVEIEI